VLVLVIALVVVVAGGGLLVANKLGALGGSIKVTGTAPAFTGDWTRGVTQSWSQEFPTEWDGWYYDYSSWLLTPQGWVISDTAALHGFDPATGQATWSMNFGDRDHVSCAHTPVNGKLACLESLWTNAASTSQVCLIDPQTGEQQCLGIDGAVTTQYGWSIDWEGVVAADGALFVNGSTGDESEGAHQRWAVALRIDVDPLKVVWTNAFAPGACGSADPTQTWDPSSNGTQAVDAGDGRGVTANVFWYRGHWQGDYGVQPFAVDTRNGESILPPNTCPEIVPVTGDTFIVPNDIQPGPVTLPSGGQVIFVHAVGGALAYGTPCSSNAGTSEGDVVYPAVPVYYTVAAGGSASFEMGTLGVIDGASWDVTLRLQHFLAGSEGSYLNAAAAGNTVVVAGGSGEVVAVDYTTGQVQWSAMMPSDAEHGAVSDAAVFILGDAVAVTSQDPASPETTLFSLATGQQIGQMPGYAVVSRDGSMLGIVTGRSITRYVPDPEGWQAPADMPSCPSGGTPVAWTKYADGSMLICSRDGEYEVVASQGWAARQIDWTAGGYTVTFSNRATIQGYLGGSLVYVDYPHTTDYVASEAWTVSSGPAGFGDQTPGVTACPTGTYPVSLSTWDGGWLLVCGTSASAPTSLAFKDGSAGQEELTTVDTSTGGGYCAEGPPGQVCVYRSPALVVINGEQHSIDHNYFLGAGAGGAGQGAGSYGVPAPDATAHAQVQYLVAILSSSAAMRTSIDQPSRDIMACQNLPDAVIQIQWVAQNRVDLMAALGSTPVDHIPNGTQLVTQLRAALEASFNADEAFVDWGRAQQSSGCSPEPQKAIDADQAAGDAKDAFCVTWNTQIAPVYGVPQFTTSQI